MKILSRLIFIKKYEYINLDNSKNILIIRQHNQLGDMLCATPMFRALRERFPDASITLVSGPVNTQVVKNNPYLTHVIEYNNIKILKRPKLLFDFIKELRKIKYDFAVVPVTVSMSVTSDLIAFFSKAKYRIGVSNLSGVENRTGFLYNYPVSLEWKNGIVRHQTFRNMDIMKDFSLRTSDHSLIIGLSLDERAYADDYYRRNHKEGKISIGIHPGAGKIPNQWPVEHFGELIERLVNNNNCEIYISEGPMDKIQVDFFREKFGNKICYIFEQNIRNVAAILNKFSLVISNDTGVMHVAAATSAPVLSLFGKTDPTQWAPQRKCDRYLVGKNNDILNISIDEVYESAVQIIRMKDKGDFNDERN